MPTDAFTPIEQEAIVLKVVWDLIDDMVNFAMFEHPLSHDDTNLLFKSSSESQLFRIHLVDFLSLPQARGKKPIPFGLPAPPAAPPSDRTYLFHLRRLVAEPLLGMDAGPLAKVVEAFGDWLDADCLIPEMNLWGIDAVLDVTAPRIDILRICGDTAKHNFSRLEANVAKIAKMITAAGRPIETQEAYLALPTFAEWINDNVWLYHASTIAEFLNNIRWAIYGYLRPEFERAFERTAPPAYRFKAPAGCESPLAQVMHWDLMNAIRNPPYFPRFRVTPFLKLRY
jgi:hypothetical protein